MTTEFLGSESGSRKAMSGNPLFPVPMIAAGSDCVHVHEVQARRTAAVVLLVLLGISQVLMSGPGAFAAEKESGTEIEYAGAQQAMARYEKAAALADKIWRESTLRAKKSLATELRSAQVAAVRGKADADAARIAALIGQVETDIRTLSDESLRPTLGADVSAPAARESADKADAGDVSPVTPAEFFRSLPAELRPPNSGEWDIVAQAKAADFLRTQFRGRLIRFRGQITQRPSVTVFNGVTRVYIYVELMEEGLRRGAVRVVIQAVGAPAEALAQKLREGETINAVAPFKSIQLGNDTSYLYVDTPLPADDRR